MGQAIGRGPSPSFLPLHSSQIVSSEGSTAHARRTSEILEYRTGEACGTEKIASSADGFCLPGSAWEVWPVPSPPLSPGCLGWGGAALSKTLSHPAGFMAPSVYLAGLPDPSWERLAEKAHVSSPQLGDDKSKRPQLSRRERYRDGGSEN